MGPLAGAAIELIKILLNFAINGTMTAGVGEIANFLIGCSLVVPAALIYHKKHTRTGAVAGMAAGTVFMTVVGCFLNASYYYRHMPKHSVCRSTAWLEWELP